MGRGTAPQTRTSHQRDVEAARDIARADRNQAADRAREPGHTRMRGQEHRWARTWADRRTATPAKAAHDRSRAAAGITPTTGDSVDATAVAAAVAQRRRDRLTAQTLTRRPAPTSPKPESGRGGPDTSHHRPYQPPGPDRGRSR